MSAERVTYFAFGSNMCSAVLKDRVPSAVFTTVAWLPWHSLRFHKISNDGSAKCDAFFTNDNSDCVFGVVFELDLAEKPALDRAEGLGRGYEQKSVTVIGRETNREIEALTYYATKIDCTLDVYHWYKDRVLMGAREHKLPAAYIASIQRVDSVDDPDPSRARERRAVLTPEQDAG